MAKDRSMLYRYDTYPYPERSPAEERNRLVTGSPSALRELDHYVFGGRRDWTEPFRALIAGGGTGDGLVMLAQQLADVGVPHRVVYLDRSAKSRDIAAKRARVRGLSSIDFVVGDLLEAEGLGRFDYIDCCGVLHHLPDPQAGARRLAGLLAPGGGVGGMVYAPLGRTGVYPMQSALLSVLGGLPYREQVRDAKAILRQLPRTNWLLRNPFLGDHKASDAGLFDLLLHTRDRPFWADELIAMLAAAGLRVEALVEPIRYDPQRLLPAGSEAARVAAGLDPARRARLAEELSGAIKVHVFYARPAGSTPHGSPLSDPGCVLHLMPSARLLADQIERGNDTVRVTLGGIEYARRFGRSTAAILRHMDGRRPLSEILRLADRTELEPGARGDLKFLADINQLHASRLPPAA